MHKIYEILEGTIALTALIGIIGVSTVSVMALNPNPTTATQNVAGTSTGTLQQAPTGTFLVNNLTGDAKNYSANLEMLNGDQGYLYSSMIKPTSLEVNEQFVEILNTTDKDASITFDTQLNGNVQDDLTLKVGDNLDTLVLYSPDLGVNKVSLTIPANGKRVLSVSYTFVQKINFAFEVSIKLR